MIENKYVHICVYQKSMNTYVDHVYHMWAHANLYMF
jgi:hypothetical protein